MGERHVEELFSAAYDHALVGDERRRYEAHVASCSQCASGFAEFRAALDAVHALPSARMPVRVVLPSTPPVAERRSLPAWLRVPRLSPAWSAGVMGAAGIAAVVVAVHAHGGAGGGTTAATGLSPLSQRALAGGGGQDGSAPRAAVPAAYCASPVMFTTAEPGVTAGGSPAGFSNRVAITNPQRPGQELVLATTSSHYSPGEQVLVFAALTTSSGAHTAIVPCVSLEQTGSLSVTDSGAAAAAGPASKSAGSSSDSQPQANAPAQEFGALNGPVHFPLAVAIPTMQTIGSTLTVQVVTIPATIPRGTTLQLVAVIPQGIPGDADRQPIEAVLTLEVS